MSEEEYRSPKKHKPINKKSNQTTYESKRKNQEDMELRKQT